jgi:superfamily II DNA or RNA helicase
MSVELNQENEILLFGDKKARWYQVAALHAVEQALEQNEKRILVVSPTGTGKTLTSGLIFSSDRVRKALKIRGSRPLRLLFIAHVHRLLSQAEQTYADAANIELIPWSAFTPLPNNMEWDIACIDEAHHEAMLTIQYQLEPLGNRPIIGLTATPDRADGCLIKFETIINPMTREQAVEQGFLARTYLNSIVDTPTKDKTVVAKSLIDYYGHEFGQTLMFFRTKNELRSVHEHLVGKGYASVCCLDQTPIQLDNILDQFSAGEIEFVLNCNKLNEGIDVNGCTDVFLGRQFGSYPQLNQVIGRASRPDSDCNVWELINPLSNRNLDTTVVVGTPERHRLISKFRGDWVEREFDYVSSYSMAA